MKDKTSNRKRTMYVRANIYGRIYLLPVVKKYPAESVLCRLADGHLRVIRKEEIIEELGYE